MIKNLLGVLPRTEKTPKLPVKVHNEDSDIPEFFDAREAWPECKDIISTIRDQAACGSCWAFGAVEAMSDRICIHSNGTVKVQISAEDLNDCCFLCGSCTGGWPETAWSHWQDNGIVTGGLYGSNQGCKPYTIPTCDHYIADSKNPCGPYQDTPACEKTCISDSGLEYEKDLHKGSSAYSIGPDEKQIQLEILKNGPIETVFVVYEDFVSYKNGVYQKVEGNFLGSHAIKILGWGVEDDVPYWLAANSWNEHWGDKGFFKILRGSNECAIESYVVAGLPAY